MVSEEVCPHIPDQGRAEVAPESARMPYGVLSLEDVEKRLDEILHIDPARRDQADEELLKARDAFLEVCRRRVQTPGTDDNKAAAFVAAMSQELPPDYRKLVYHLFGSLVPEGTEELEKLLEACSPQRTEAREVVECEGIQAFCSTTLKLCNRISVCFAEEATLLSDILASFYGCNASSDEFEAILKACRESHKDMVALSVGLSHLGCISDYSILPQGFLDLLESPEKIDSLTKSECFDILSSLTRKFEKDVPQQLSWLEPHALEAASMLADARRFQEDFVAGFRSDHLISDDMIPKRRCRLEKISDVEVARQVAELAQRHRRDPSDPDFEEQGGFILNHPVTEFQMLGRSGQELVTVRPSDKEKESELDGFITFVGGMKSDRIDPKPPVELQAMAVTGYCSMVAVDVEHVFNMLLMAMAIHVQRSETDLVTVEIATDNQRSFRAALASGIELLPERLLEDDTRKDETVLVSHLDDEPPAYRVQFVGGALMVSPTLRKRFERVWQLSEAVDKRHLSVIKRLREFI